MREWRRVPAATLCGGCGERIEAETPALFIRLGSVRRQLMRCAACIGEAPPDLPARPVQSRLTKAFKPISAAISKDVRQIVERPRYGEDR